VQTSPDANPSHVIGLSHTKTSLPWSLLVCPAVVVPCSALASTVLLGGTFTSLGVPVILAIALPLGFHGGAVFATWEGVRTDDERTLLFLRRVIGIIAAVMAILGVLVADRHFSETLTMFIALPVSFSAGPLVLAGLLGVSRSRSTTANSRSEPEQSQS
jgi:hypothetical protein